MTDSPDPLIQNVCFLVQEQQVYACKTILAAWSPVFRSMLFNGMKETTEDTISLVEENYEDFSLLMQFLHPPVMVELNMENIGPIADLADKYQMEGFMQHVIKFMLGRSECDEIADVLVVADRCRLQIVIDRLLIAYSLQTTDVSKLKNLSPENVFRLLEYMTYRKEYPNKKYPETVPDWYLKELLCYQQKKDPNEWKLKRSMFNSDNKLVPITSAESLAAFFEFKDEQHPGIDITTDGSTVQIRRYSLGALTDFYKQTSLTGYAIGAATLNGMTVTNDNTAIVYGNFAFWKDANVGFIMQFNVNTKIWETLGKGTYISDILVYNDRIIIIGEFWAFQENYVQPANNIGSCDLDGWNCYQLGSGLSDFLGEGSLEVWNDVIIASYSVWVASNQTIYCVIQQYDEISQTFLPVWATETSTISCELKLTTIHNTTTNSDILYFGGKFRYSGNKYGFGWWDGQSVYIYDVGGDYLGISISSFNNTVYYSYIDDQGNSIVTRWNSTTEEFQPELSLRSECIDSGKLDESGNRLAFTCGNGTWWKNVTEGEWYFSDLGVTTSFTWALNDPMENSLAVSLVTSTENSLNDFVGILYNTTFQQKYETTQIQAKTFTVGDLCAYQDQLYFVATMQGIGNISISEHSAWWNGTHWLDIPYFVSKCGVSESGFVVATNFAKEGDLLIGFTTEYSDNFQYTFIELPEFLKFTSVQDLAGKNGDIYIAFSHTAVVSYVVKFHSEFNGTYSYNVIANITESPFLTVLSFQENILYIGGCFKYQIGNLSYVNIAKYDVIKGEWLFVELVGDSSNLVLGITFSDTMVYISGQFSKAGRSVVETTDLVLGSISVRNLAGMNSSGIFVDSLAGGVLSAFIRYIVWANSSVWFLAQNVDCTNLCGTLYFYDPNTQAVSYPVASHLVGLVGSRQSSKEDSTYNLYVILGAVMVTVAIFLLGIITVLFYRRHHHGRISEELTSLLSVEGTSQSDFTSGLIDFHNDSFDMKNILGKGSFGTVWSCVFPNHGGATFAVKQILLSVGDKNSIKMIENEIKTNEKLSHKNIAQYLGHRKRSAGTLIEFFIFMELFEKPSSLQGFITKQVKNNSLFSVGQVIEYLGQIAEGLEYLHNNGIAHRDLKSANVLVRTRNNRINTLHITDFGLATSSSLASTVLGTANFMAPEVLNSKDPYDPLKADVWSFGILIFELVTLTEPQSMQIRPVLPRHLTEDENWKNISDLYDTCTQIDPKNRPTASVLVQMISFM